MATKTPAIPKPQISGFCNITLPRTLAYDPHQRCPGCDCTAPGCPCNPDPPQETTVTDQPETGSPDTETAPEPPETETPAPEPGSPEDAVAQLRSAAALLNTSMAGYQATHWHDAARLLDSLRKVTALLGMMDATLVQWLYLHGEHGLHQQVPGIAGAVNITRGRSKERWAAPEAVREYVDRKMGELEGEIPDPEVVVGWVLEVLPAGQSTSLRKTPLRAAGIDLEDYYWSEPGTLQVGLPKPDVASLT
jgi:hypothetical protein